jgi:hypothetical protein
MLPASTQRRLGKAVVEAVAEFRRMRREGVSVQDAAKGIEYVLRDAWPVTIPEDDPRLHRACLTCDDTGWEPYTARHRAVREPVQFVRFCHCLRGQNRLRNCEKSDPKSDEDALISGAAQRRKSGFKRI